MVEGTENGDHVVRDRLALLQRLSHERIACGTPIYFLFSLDFPLLCLFVERENSNEKRIEIVNA
jgi:hypothetical protein